MPPTRYSSLDEVNFFQGKQDPFRRQVRERNIDTPREEVGTLTLIDSMDRSHKFISVTVLRLTS